MDNNNTLEKCNKIYEKYVKKNKINHAYLLETNIEDRISVAKQLVKKILELTDDNITVEKLYRNGDLKIIQTTSQYIKKEEITNLKEEFKTKSIYSDIRIYIIEEAEKLNSSSSNTLLKFLEEPEQNIIAILVTCNKDKVLNTIVSRCQNIRIFQKENYNVEKSEFYDKIFEFLLLFEEKKEKTVAYFYKYFKKETIDRKTINDILEAILYAYSDVIHDKTGIELDYYKEYQKEIKELSKYNSTFDIQSKIKVVTECIENMKYNPNAKLLVDKLIISMSGVDLNV